MDHVVEKDKFSDGGVNENFYKVLSKSGATTTNQSLFKIKFLQLANMMDVLDGSSNVLTAKDDDKHLIQNGRQLPTMSVIKQHTKHHSTTHVQRNSPLEWCHYRNSERFI